MPREKSSINIDPDLAARAKNRLVAMRNTTPYLSDAIEMALEYWLQQPLPPRTLMERTMAAMREPEELEIPERYLPLMAELAKVLDNADPEDQDFLVRRLVLDWWERRVLKTEREKP